MKEGKTDAFYRQADAMIRFFFKEDPDKLNDYEYVKRYKELVWLGKEGFLSGMKL